MTPLVLTPVKPAYTSKELADDARFFLSEGRHIRIRFIKKDGTERTAVVTSNLSCIPADKHPRPCGIPRNVRPRQGRLDLLP